MFSVLRRNPCRDSLTLSLSRHYAVSVSPGKVFSGKRMPRVFTAKKGWQYALYKRMLDEGMSTSPLIFLQFDQFSAKRLQQLRVDIDTAFLRVKPSPAPPVEPQEEDMPTEEVSADGEPTTPTKPKTKSPPIDVPKPKVMVVRTSIFGAALRDMHDLSPEARLALAQSVDGQLAVLTIPTFTNPPQLAAIFRLLDRTLPPRIPPTEAQIAKALEEKNADPATPGRRIKTRRRELHPDLVVVGGIIDGNAYLKQEVRDIAKMPTLETLRMQILGLIAAPGSNLVGALSEASGGSLLRALDGYRRGLEEPVVEEAQS